jgi:CRP/FNR family transcriptional regulator, cyclic AMP receptor protein
MSSILELFRDYQPCHFDLGQVVIQQGAETNCLYFLIDGEIEILKDEVRVATASQPGVVFGEMAMLLGGKNTTTVRALKASSFYRVENPREFLKSSPTVCLHVCDLLARRLDALSRYLVDVKRQFEGHDHIGMVDEVIDTLLHRHPQERIRPKGSTIEQGELPN